MGSGEELLLLLPSSRRFKLTGLVDRALVPVCFCPVFLIMRLVKSRGDNPVSSSVIKTKPENHISLMLSIFHIFACNVLISSYFFW